MTFTKILSNEKAMLNFGGQLATHVCDGLVIFLNGNLGAGKTTLVRGFLRQLGYNGAVKSPTFTLLESYVIINKQRHEQSVFHFDLYRLCDPEELDYMGLSDYLDGNSVVLIEWPDKGQGFLPLADIVITIDYLGKQREIEMIAQTSAGALILQNIENN